MECLKKSGKTFMVGFTGGGEPFLIPNFVQACREIIREHYIRVITNLSCDSVALFAEEIDPGRVSRINASIHFKQLECHNKMQTFIDYYHLLCNKGFSIRTTAVAYPPFMAEARRYRAYFEGEGVPVNFVPYSGWHVSESIYGAGD